MHLLNTRFNCAFIRENVSYTLIKTKVCNCVLIPYRNGTASVVTSNFGGILQNEVNCLICGTESRKFDPFLGKQVKDRLGMFCHFQCFCDFL